MIFNEFRFLLLFLPLTFILFYCPGLRSFRPYLLILASFIFYATAGLEHAAVLLFDIAWIFILTQMPGFQGNRRLLLCASIPPVFALLYYKYTYFILQNLPVERIDLIPGSGIATESGMLWDIALPAGISFFTFQLVGYAIDRYRGTVTDPPSAARFTLFISFFPQLVAGPIVRYEQVRAALTRLRDYRLTAADASSAIVYTVSGLMMKVLVADALARSLAPLIIDPAAISRLEATYLILGYSFQIYFDFYGYSLIAIGLALLFGIRLPQNFNRPYSALNPREFWRCWHMTLSYWIRDYLYRPLGGNRRYIINIALTFAICGLWHGAAWSFVIWGLYHAVLVTGYKLAGSVWDRMPRLAQQVLTFLLVSIGWLLFIFDLNQIADLAVNLSRSNSYSMTMMNDPQIDWLILAASVALCYLFRTEPLADRPRKNLGNAVVLGVAAASMACITLLFIDVSNTFIYFRF